MKYRADAEIVRVVIGHITTLDVYEIGTDNVTVLTHWSLTRRGAAEWIRVTLTVWAASR